MLLVIEISSDQLPGGSWKDKELSPTYFNLTDESSEILSRRGN